MKKLNGIGLCLLAIGFVSACAKNYNAKVNMLPKESGEIVLHSTSSSEGDAMEGAKAKGEEYCAQQGKQMVLVSEPKAAYQGVQKGGWSGAASAIFGKGGSKDDYKVEMVIKCK